jgi:hypothetical protein
LFKLVLNRAQQIVPICLAGAGKNVAGKNAGWGGCPPWRNPRHGCVKLYVFVCAKQMQNKAEITKPGQENTSPGRRIMGNNAPV